MNENVKIHTEQEAAAQTLAAHQEIEELSGSVHNFKFEKMLIEKNGEVIEIEVPIDDIDMLDDFDDEDLTEEGERSLGIIKVDHDTTSGESPEKSSRNTMMAGSVEKVTKSVYNNALQQFVDIVDYVITCPHTNSTEVYRISSNVYASYETNEPFKVSFKNLDEED